MTKFSKLADKGRLTLPKRMNFRKSSKRPAPSFLENHVAISPPQKTCLKPCLKVQNLQHNFLDNLTTPIPPPSFRLLWINTAANIVIAEGSGWEERLKIEISALMVRKTNCSFVVKVGRIGKKECVNFFLTSLPRQVQLSQLDLIKCVPYL